MSGRIRNSAEQTIESHAEDEFGEANLPVGWAIVRLNKISVPSRPRRDPQGYPSLPYVGLEQIESNTGRLLGTSAAAEMKSTAFHFQPNDVLYGRLRPYLNKVWRAVFEGLCSSEFIVLPPSNSFESNYLAFFLSTDEFVSFANLLNQGDRPRVSYEQIGQHPIPLPPLAEQRRIVAKLETLLGKISSNQQRLSRVPSLLKRFRQSVLAAACSGRLTADWREDNSNELTEKRLQELSDKRRRRWISANPKQSPSDYVQPISPNNEAELFSIPESWVWIRAEQACDFITKGTTPPPNSMTAGFGDIPFIKVYNLTNRGHLDFTVNPTFISDATHTSGVMRRSCVRPGDVLMNLVGPPLGKVSIVPATFPEWNTNQAVAIYRPVTGMASEFLAMSLLTGPIIAWAMARSKATVGQHNLTLELARNVRVPLPSLREQLEIVRRVEQLFAFADQIEGRLKQAQAHVDRLTQSLLRKAFRGELVPTEANLAAAEGRDYESASVLLERIQTSQPDARTKPKTKRSRPAK
jgi:type I restriction enzyme S subunit